MGNSASIGEKILGIPSESYSALDIKAKGFTNMMMIGQRLFTGRVAVAQAALTFTRKLYEATRDYRADFV